MRRARSRVAVALAIASVLVAGAVPGGQPTAHAQAPETQRVAGAERAETAERLAYERFPDGAGTAYLATAGGFADALAAGPAAAADGGPVLLVRHASVPEPTRRALRALGVRDAVVLGGERAVGAPVVDELEDITGNPVRRLSGATRFETAARVSERFEPGVEVAYVVNGSDFPDALGGAAAGAATGGPVLLATRDGLGQASRDALTRLRPGRVDVLGGTAVLSDAVVEEAREASGGQVRRLSGPDRFATSAAVSAATFPAGAGVAFLATGLDHPDALAAGPVAGLGQAPLLLARRHCVPDPVLQEIDRLGVGLVVLVGGEAALSRGPARLEPCGVEVTEVATGLRAPWDVAFAGGRAFVSERDTGRILELAGGGATAVQTFAVDNRGEGGLLGLTASPRFEQDGLLYAYLTTARDNRVVRFRPGEPGSVTAVVTGIPRSPSGIHHGGRIAFDPAGELLYVATGDAQAPAAAQDPGSLAGKILRVRPDGGIPPDNPFPDSPVYALGFRNAQGLAWVGEQLYVTDFGPDCDDEVNLVRAGGNYGWPDGCGRTRPGAMAPLVVRQPPEASWSGLAALRDGLLSPWEGDLFAAALRGRRLWRFRVEGGAVTQAQELLAGDHGRLRHAAQAPDGSLWVLTSNRDGRGDARPGDDRILRLAPPGW